MQYIELTTIHPIETLVVPEALDGKNGSNRGDVGRAQIAATNDLEAIRAWLANYTDSRNTFDSYRKEAERLLLWCVLELRKPLSSMLHEDLVVYQSFLKDPQPSERWVSADGAKYSRDDARWRPFIGPLSTGSQRLTKTILNTMFNWLVSSGYLRGNPMALGRQRTKRAASRVTRYLSISLWDEVKSYVEQMPQVTNTQIALYARYRWMTTLFYLQGMRISEVASGQMGHFFRRLGEDGHDQWWLEILGKGEKDRIVPVSADLVSELRRYREANGLCPLPSRSDETPLLIPFRGANRCLHRSAVHDAIKGVFRGAAAWLRSRGPEFDDRADELDRASAHWLRHTAGSHMADGGVDLRTVRDNLGHASLTTTSLYLHAADDVRHRETVARHTMKWDEQRTAIAPNDPTVP